jgi:hypothetical protein
VLWQVVWAREELAPVPERVLDAGPSAASEVVPTAKSAEAEEAPRTSTVWAEEVREAELFRICRRICRGSRVGGRRTCRTSSTQVPREAQARFEALSEFHPRRLSGSQDEDARIGFRTVTFQEAANASSHGSSTTVTFSIVHRENS